MILSLVLCSLFVGAVIMLAASVLHAQERSANRAVRWIWSAAIALTLLLTALLPVRGRSGVADMRALDTGSRVAQPLLPTRSDDMLLARIATTVRNGIDAATAPLEDMVQAANAVSPTVQRTVLAVWVLASVAAILILLVVYRRIHRRANTWQQEELQGATVRVSANAGPAVIGIRPMEIVVPAWILTRPDAEQRLVLSHEREHIRARDPLLLLGACTAVALMPWNPMLWYALSRLRLAVEIDCDRRVLQRGIAPMEYGRLLLDLSQHPSSLAGSLPALAYSTSHLERRLLAMTSRPARFIIARRVSGAVVAVAALLAACESKLPTSAEVENMDASVAVAQASRLPGIDSGRTVFLVDGKAVTGAEAKSYEASRISSIEVVKGDNRTAQVRLRTKGPDSLTLTASKFRIVRDSADGPGLMLRKRSGVALDSAVTLVPSRQPMMRSKTAFEGVFVIDGQPVSAEAANTLKPDRIESVEVIKGAAATRLSSDPRAVNGIIKITTKK